MTAGAATREWRSFATRVSVLFAAFCVVLGITTPYLPVWLDWVGLSAREIAVSMAAPLAARVTVTPAIAFAADRIGDHRRFLIAMAWVGLGALILLSQCRSFWPILVSTVVFSLAMTTMMPLTETLAVHGVRSAGLDYGRMRLWGSLSFMTMTIAGGWVLQGAGAGFTIWLLVAGAMLTLAAAHALPHSLSRNRRGSVRSRPRLTLADAAGLMRFRPFLTFLLASGAVQATHAVLYTFGVLHWRALGLDTSWCGALWAVSIICEIALFAYSGSVVRRIGPVEMIVLGSVAALVRWIAMGFDPPLALLFVLQAMHALSYGASHIGAVHFIARFVPEQQGGTAQALYASVSGGIAMGGAVALAGPLYASHGGRAYWAMAAIAGVAVVAGLALVRMRPLAQDDQPHSRVSGG
jgi:MFS transporter, PPP family, 3-phenylpropionic acid transporter